MSKKFLAIAAGVIVVALLVAAYWIMSPQPIDKRDGSITHRGNLIRLNTQ